MSFLPSGVVVLSRPAFVFSFFHEVADFEVFW